MEGAASSFDLRSLRGMRVGGAGRGWYATRPRCRLTTSVVGSPSGFQTRSIPVPQPEALPPHKARSAIGYNSKWCWNRAMMVASPSMFRRCPVVSAKGTRWRKQWSASGRQSSCTSNRRGMTEARRLKATRPPPRTQSSVIHIAQAHKGGSPHAPSIGRGVPPGAGSHWAWRDGGGTGVPAQSSVLSPRRSTAARCRRPSVRSVGATPRRS